MADLSTPLLKLLTAGPFQRSPRPKVSVGKLVTALQRMGNAEANQADLVVSLQQVKGKGYANTQPKILLPSELETATFEIWITPLGRDALAAALAG